MAKRIMVLLGSPRKNGNTAKVLNWVNEELASLGCELDLMHIMDYKVEGCCGCYKCNAKVDTECVIKDDAQALQKRMTEADVILFATPLYCWGFPAQIKALLDRCVALTDFKEDSDSYNSRLAGKSMALLVTAGGPVENNTEPISISFKNMAAYLKANELGQLIIPFCTIPDNIGDDIKEKAIDFARQIA